MARTSFIEHRGVRIAYLDFANIPSTADALAAIEEAGKVVQGEPLRSVRTLTNVAGSRFNTEIMQAIKRLVVNNRPHVLAGALVGLSGLQTVAYTTLMRFSKRNIPAFSSIEAAKDWLSEQT